MRLKIDLHMHSTFSDGTDTPRELLEKVKGAGVGLFSLTDHDAIEGCAEIVERLAPGDPEFITGAEFTCRDEQGKYHILGYAYDPASRHILDTVRLGHDYRIKKTEVRLGYLRERFGFTFPEDDIRALYAEPNPGKPHLGNLMVKMGYAASRDEAIKEYIDGYKGAENCFLRPEEAITGILGAGGIPVLAHPCYGDGRQRVFGDELEMRVVRLMRMGLQGLEGFYSEYTAQHRREVLALARRYGLYVTAGSDCHGENRPVPLADTGLEEESAPPEGLLRFLRDTESRRYGAPREDTDGVG